ncbi:MAG: NAD-dependent epimerase/dehydratase family protein [Rikenellaceae bacterium]
MRKRATIVGGAGLIGSHVAAKLLGLDYKVTIIDIRDIAQSSPLAKLNATAARHFKHIRHNIVDPIEIKAHEIYNLAASTPLSNHHQTPIEELKREAMGGINILEQARKHSAKVLYGSSSDIYLPMRHLETSSREEQRIIRCEAKQIGEALHNAYAKQWGVDIRIARIFATYCAAQSTLDNRVVMKMIMQALHNQDITIYGSGEQVRTLCSAPEMADGLIALMASEVVEPPLTLDMGADEQITIRELAEMIIELTNSKSRITHLQPRAAEPYAKTPKTAMAEEQLNWRAKRTIADGVAEMIDEVRATLNAEKIAQSSWAEINL